MRDELKKERNRGKREKMITTSGSSIDPTDKH